MAFVVGSEAMLADANLGGVGNVVRRPAHSSLSTSGLAASVFESRGNMQEALQEA